MATTNDGGNEAHTSDGGGHTNREQSSGSQDRNTRSGQGNRGRGGSRSRHARNRNGGERQPNTPSFEGREPTLKGHIYDYNGERNTDQYIRTTREITQWVGRTFDDDRAECVEAMRTLNLTMPVEPTPPTGADLQNPIIVGDYRDDRKEARRQTKSFNNFKSGLYNTVIGQCTEAMTNRLESHEDYLTVKTEQA